MVNLPFEKLLADEGRASMEMSMSKNIVSHDNSLNEQKFQWISKEAFSLKSLKNDDHSIS